jgi:hypothetical protein
METLAEVGDVDVIFAMDDETAQGAFKGYLDAGFDEKHSNRCGLWPFGRARKRMDDASRSA